MEYSESLASSLFDILIHMLPTHQTEGVCKDATPWMQRNSWSLKQGITPKEFWYPFVTALQASHYHWYCSCGAASSRWSSIMAWGSVQMKVWYGGGVDKELWLKKLWLLLIYHSRKKNSHKNSNINNSLTMFIYLNHKKSLAIGSYPAIHVHRNFQCWCLRLPPHNLLAVIWCK